MQISLSNPQIKCSSWGFHPPPSLKKNLHYSLSLPLSSLSKWPFTLHTSNVHHPHHSLFLRLRRRRRRCRSSSSHLPLQPRPRLRHRHRLCLPRPPLHRPSCLLPLLPPPPPFSTPLPKPRFRCQLLRRHRPTPHHIRGRRRRRGPERRRWTRPSCDWLLPEVPFLQIQHPPGFSLLNLSLRVQGLGDAENAAGLPPLLPSLLRRRVVEAQRVLPCLPELAAAHSSFDAAVGAGSAVAVPGWSEEEVTEYDLTSSDLGFRPFWNVKVLVVVILEGLYGLDYGSSCLEWKKKKKKKPRMSICSVSCWNWFCFCVPIDLTPTKLLNYLWRILTDSKWLSVFLFAICQKSYVLPSSSLEFFIFHWIFHFGDWIYKLI